MPEISVDMPGMPLYNGGYSLTNRQKVMIRIEGIDNQGTPRTYGIGRSMDEAIRECIAASERYLPSRPDIPALYLRDSADHKMLIMAGTSIPWKVPR